MSSRRNTGLRAPTRRSSPTIRPGGPERAPCTSAARPSSPQATHAWTRPRAAATSHASDVLPTPGRAHEAEQRRRRVRPRQPHGDVVEEALLHGAVSDMPRVQHGPRVGPRSEGSAARFVQGRLTRHCRYSRPLACSGSEVGIPSSRARTSRPRVRTASGSSGASSCSRRRVEPVRVAGARIAQVRRYLLRRDAHVDERRVAGLEPQAPPSGRPSSGTGRAAGRPARWCSRG